MNLFENNYLIFQFFIALISTIIIETIVIFSLSKSFSKIFPLSIKDIFFTGFITSFATLPYLWFIFSPIFGNGLSFIVIGELFAFIIESFIYYFILKNISFYRCVILSFIANLVSFLVGFLIF